MTKVGALLLASSVNLFAVSANDQLVLDFISANIKSNPSVTLKEIKIAETIPLAQVKGWDAVKVKMTVDVKGQGEKSNTETLFRSGSVVAFDLFDMKKKESLKNSLLPKATATEYRKDRIVAGNKSGNAKYKILVFSDPLCPFCRSFIPKAIKDMKKVSERDRATEDKKGLDLEITVVHPLTGELIPVWVANFVLASYGGGAVMAVPAHDQRDFEFASKYKLDIKIVIDTKSGIINLEEAFTEPGILVDSDEFTDMKNIDAKDAIINHFEKKTLGTRKINYKLRDWGVSRQRYWGEPFPLVHAKGKVNPISEDDLPVLLPEVEKYKPSGTGDSPLANITDWVEMKDDSGNIIGLRETHTMPQWAGSCWYYLRYIDPLNTQEGWNSKKEQYWMPVDLYIGGQEHAVLHLM